MLCCDAAVCLLWCALWFENLLEINSEHHGQLLLFFLFVLVAASCMAKSFRLPLMPTPSTCGWTLLSAWSSRTRREGQSMCRYDVS